VCPESREGREMLASAARTHNCCLGGVRVCPESSEGRDAPTCATAGAVETVMGSAQDVEGCIVGDDVHVVQTRPQV
jgi:hypothetical protein